MTRLAQHDTHPAQVSTRPGTRATTGSIRGGQAPSAPKGPSSDEGAAQGPKAQGPSRAVTAPPDGVGLTEAGPLDTYANSAVGGQDRRWMARRGRFDARRALWDVTTLKRVRKCGRTAVDGAGVGVRASEGGPGERVVGYRGLATCASTWACPRCASVIAAHRAEELRQGLHVWNEKGGAVVLLTLTIRHHKGQRLADLWDSVAGCWRKLTGRKIWRQYKEQAGVAGALRVAETTYSLETGWHTHLHVVLFVDPERAQCIWMEAAEELGGPQFAAQYAALVSQRMVLETWDTLVRSEGYDTVSEAQDMRPVNVDDAADLGGYFRKSGWDAAAEVTGGQAWKHGRTGSRTPFQVLHDFMATGDVDDLDVWREWERASHRRRQMTWSRGLRDLLGLNKTQRTDDDIAAEGDDGAMSDEQIASQSRGDDDLVVIPGPVWKRIVREGREAELLEVAELSENPEEEVRKWLREAMGWDPGL